MEHRPRLYLLIAVAAFAAAADARVFMTQQEALARAFPAGARVTRQPVFLSKEQLAAAKRESGLEFGDQLIVRYVGTVGDRVAGYAYFDTHRVRTLPETVMVLLTPGGRVERIEILSFDEPQEYAAKQRWIDQFRGRRLDDNLALNRAVRPISGASLTGRAILNASRKVLALHRAIGAAPPK